MARMVTYECRKCGTKVVVTESHASGLQPIFCCGMEAAEVDSVRRQLGAKAPRGADNKGKAKRVKAAGKAATPKTAGGTRASAEKKVSKYTKKK